MSRRTPAMERAFWSTGYGPHGMAKEKAKIDLWLKEIAPSNELRKRFNDKSDDWDAFCTAYSAELKGAVAQAAANVLIGRLEQGPVTLLYAARDEGHNNAVALKQWLDRRRRRA
jgi:uncharacterized protein YeaO (DUF488 family)